MHIQAGFSADGKTVKLVLSTGATQASIMNAQELEELISSLAQIRSRITPAVSLSEIPSQAHIPAPETKNPEFAVSASDDHRQAAVLTIAYPGLGVRSVVLSHKECQQLGGDLLLHSAQGPQN